MVKTAKAKPKTVLKVVPAAKPAADPGKNDLEKEAFHYHLGVITQMQAAVDFHKKNLKNARRAAQDGGIVLHDLDTVIRMREEEPETVQTAIKRLATYAYWLGLAPGVQGDLFQQTAAAVNAEVVAEEEGYVEGLEGRTAEGERYDVSNPIGQARLKGWNRGQDVVKKHFVARSEAKSAEAAAEKAEKAVH